MQETTWTEDFGVPILNQSYILDPVDRNRIYHFKGFLHYHLPSDYDLLH